MFRRGKSDERGAAAVEFALVSLILITLVGVIFQFSVYLWAFQAASNGAREGARAWAVNPCGTANSTQVTNAVSPAFQPGTLTATPAFAKASGNTAASKEPGDTVTVTVTMQPRAIGYNLVPGMTWSITKTATARVEDVQGC